MATMSHCKLPHPTDTPIQRNSIHRTAVSINSLRGPLPLCFPPPLCSLPYNQNIAQCKLALSSTSTVRWRRGEREISQQWLRLSAFRNSLSPIKACTARREGIAKHKSLFAEARSSEFEVSTTGNGVGITAGMRDILSVLNSKRAQVVAMLAMALVLCNADRVIMSVAIVPLCSANGWGEGVAGIVQSSFLWGYMVTPVLGGGLADRFGGKRVLATGMCLWSGATCLTPWAAGHSLPALLAMRVLMGVGEGVAFPCMNNIIAKWVPKEERARATSISMAGFHLGSMSGLLVAPGLMAALGLRGPFFVFAALSLCWLATWLLVIVHDPRAHPSISDSELKYILGDTTSHPPPSDPTDLTPGVVTAGEEPIKGRQLPPFRLLLSKAPVWALIVANSVHNWGYFVLLSWMPVYFNRVLGVNLKHAAWFSALPWAVMAVTGFAAAVVADLLTKRGMTTTHVRKVMQTIGFLGPAVALAMLGRARDASSGVVCLTIALAFVSFGQSGFLINCQDIGPQYAGVLYGMSNTAGTIAGIVSTASTGFLIESTGSFQTPLALCSLIYVAGTVFWNVFATGERVFY